MVLGHRFPKGIVEGFYGPPWSHIDRMYMIRFLADTGFNAYMYAPKDDPYHRSKWREDYPQDLAAKLNELIQAGNLFSIDFAFTVSPGLSMVYSSRKELELLVAKLRRVTSMGCHWVGVMLDDIDTELVHEEDKKAFRSLAEAHVHLLNSVKDELHKNGEKVRLTFCPTYYANQYLGKNLSDNDYLSEIGSGMDLGVDVLWTGRYVVPSKITERDAIEYEKVIKRKPILWDNYPVNDYFRATNERNLGLRLNLGPFRGREPSLLDHLAGYLSNPMNECEASKIPLITLHDMLSDPEGYSPNESLRASVERLIGRDGSAAFNVFLEGARASVLDPHEAEDLSDQVRFLTTSSVDVSQNRLNSLKSILERYRSAAETIRTTLTNRKLLAEIEPLLQKLGKLVALGIKSVEFAETILSEERSDSVEEDEETLFHELDILWDDLRNDRTQVLGQIAFGEYSASSEADLVNELGLPMIQRQSPVVTLYHWARNLRETEDSKEGNLR